jgi:cytochrome c peroxidase
MRRALLPLCLAIGAIAACTSGGGIRDEGASGPQAPDELALSDKELLGKRLFEDTDLSEPRGQACVSCHDPARAFSGNAGSSVGAVARGSTPDKLGTRNAPTIMYMAYSTPFQFVRDTEGPAEQRSWKPVGGQFWDGRARDLAEQAKGPFVNPREMANASVAAVIDKLRAAPYLDLFRRVYGAEVLADPERAYDAMADAIAAFELTPRFAPFSSKFDDYLRGKAELTPEEQRGFEIFKDEKRGNCMACHVGQADSRVPSEWLFTDFTYDALGVPRNAEIPDNADPSHYDLGLCEAPGIEKKVPPGFDVSSLCGKFKVPTLRNVELTAPYMHNGFFSSLRDVVRFYATRDSSPDAWFPPADDGTNVLYDDLPPELRKNVNTSEVPYKDQKLGGEPALNDQDIADLVAFMKTLTDRAATR